MPAVVFLVAGCSMLNREQAFKDIEFDTSLEFNRENLKKAWRKVILKHHPDKNPNDIKGAEERFKKAQNAHEWLLKELEHPHARHSEKPKNQSKASQSFYNSFFPRGRPKAAPIRFQMNVKCRFQHHRSMDNIHIARATEAGFWDAWRLHFQIFNSFDSAAEIMVSKDGFSPPKNAAQEMLKLLCKNPNLIKVSVPDGFFNAQQSQILKDHIEYNKKQFINHEYFIVIKDKCGALRIELKNEKSWEIFMENNAKKHAVHIVNAKLPEGGIDKLLEMLSSSSTLNSVIINESLLNEEQKKVYQALLEKFKVNKKEQFHFQIRYTSRQGALSNTCLMEFRGNNNGMLLKQCQDFFNDPKRSLTEISIANGDKKLSSKAIDMILDEIEKNQLIYKVNVKKGFLSKEQADRLNKCLEKHKSQCSDIASCEGLFTYEVFIDNPMFASSPSKCTGSELKKMLASNDKKVTKLSCENVSLNSNQLDSLLKELSKNRLLQQVSFKAGTLSKEQQSQCDNLIKKNKNRPYKYQTNWALWGAIAFACVGIALSFGILTITGLFIGGAILGKGFSHARQQYLEAYGKTTSLKLNSAENEALIAGVHSTSWKGYLKSFTQKSTYNYYDAYLNGLYAANQGHKEVKVILRSNKL